MSPVEISEARRVLHPVQIRENVGRAYLRTGLARSKNFRVPHRSFDSLAGAHNDPSCARGAGGDDPPTVSEEGKVISLGELEDEPIMTGERAHKAVACRCDTLFG